MDLIEQKISHIFINQIFDLKTQTHNKAQVKESWPLLIRVRRESSVMTCIDRCLTTLYFIDKDYVSQMVVVSK